VLYQWSSVTNIRYSSTLQAYTILESSTDSVFLHLTTSEVSDAKYGNILKSNSNGTYYGLSAEYVSRNDEGYVDFEKMKLLEGIALINVVANPEDAALTHSKQLQTRITHNDGESSSFFMRFYLSYAVRR
jgi:hypothetical protein